jgi:hypothetical protein
VSAKPKPAFFEIPDSDYPYIYSFKGAGIKCLPLLKLLLRHSGSDVKKQFPQKHRFYLRWVLKHRMNDKPASGGRLLLFQEGLPVKIVRGGDPGKTGKCRGDIDTSDGFHGKP